MPGNYTGAASGITSWPLVISEPADGDADAAATFNPAFSKLADASQYLFEWFSKLVVSNWQKAAGTAFSAGTINAIAAGDTAASDRYVLAAGSAGNTSLSNTVGQLWPAVTAVGANAYRCARCFNGLFFIGGDSGALATGTTATPTARTSNTTGKIQAFAWNGLTGGSAVYVGVADNGDTIRSTDGTTWVKTALAGAPVLNAVAYGAGLFAASTTTNHVWTSPDGTTWTDRGVVLTGLVPGADSMRFGGGLFVAVTPGGAGAPDTYSSANGIAWSKVNVGGGSVAYTPAPGALAYNGQLWLFTANGSAGAPPIYWTSYNGTTWLQRATPNTTNGLSGTTYATNPAGMLTVARNGAFLTHVLAGTEVAISLALA